MSNIKRALIAASLVVVASGAQAQVTTYIGGPKSGLTQTIGNVGAKAIRADSVYSSYAQAAPVRQRVQVPRTGFSGGARAIGADSPSYQQDHGLRAYRAAAAPGHAAVNRTSGPGAIGSDH